MANLLLPDEKGGQLQGALRYSTEISNFGIHLWPRVMIVTLVKYANGGYLAWKFLFWGQIRP
jgi:hypothetical protein